MKSLKVAAVVVLMGAGSAQANYWSLSGNVEAKNTLFSNSPLLTNASAVVSLLVGVKLGYEEASKRGWISSAKQEAAEGVSALGKLLQDLGEGKVSEANAAKLEDALKKRKKA